jgi:ABC-2 type transport system ATP-binding protein
MMIQTDELTRRFSTKTGDVDAVVDLDLQVREGELVALLGPNGAGKSTTMRMLTTLLTPTSGRAEVVGHDVVAEPAAVRRGIGYVGQGNGASNNQRVRDELVTQGRAYGLPKDESRRRADELLAALDLEGLADREAVTLSGGQRRRLDVAIGLVHRPTLLFLDEPSTGLDPQSRANLWEHILRLRRETGMTIVLTTHYLDEADAMAERVVVIDHGKLIADDTGDRLKADLAGDRILLTAVGGDAARVIEVAQRTVAPQEVDVTGDVVNLRVDEGAGNLPGLLKALDAEGVELKAAEVRRPTLDDVFLTLTGRSLREEVAA